VLLTDAELVAVLMALRAAHYVAQQDAERQGKSVSRSHFAESVAQYARLVEKLEQVRTADRKAR
jgi:hypothetical protein